MIRGAAQQGAPAGAGDVSVGRGGGRLFSGRIMLRSSDALDPRFVQARRFSQ